MKSAASLKSAGWLIILISFITFQGCASKVATTDAKGTTQITKIEPRDINGKTEVMIEGSTPLLQYTSFQLTDPLRLVVDISDAELGLLKDKISVKTGAVTEITPSQKENIARLEIGLTEAVDTKVEVIDGKLVVEIAKPSGDAKAASTPAAEVASGPTASIISAPSSTLETTTNTKPEPVAELQEKIATVVTAVKASANKEGVKVVIKADGAMKPNTFMVGEKKLVIDIPGVRSSVKPSVIPVRKGGLDKVRVGQHAAPEQKVRVVLDLTKPLAYTVTPESNSLIVAMSAALAAKPQTQAAKAEQTVTPETASSIKASEEVASSEKEIVKTHEAPAVPVMSSVVKKEAVPATKQNLGTLENALLSGGSKYAGRKISLELQDADLINVMRLFAEVANLNIILAPDVKGKVTVRMVNIPWDQAMDIILKMNGLGYVLEDNVLRIGTIGALTKEAEEEMKAKEAKKKAEDLITRIIPINYTTAGTIEPTIKKSLSARGETVVDARTNTLIVKDITRNVDEIVSLIKVLDKPIAQIMIEARIVEASLSFTREIGIQWGGGASASASTGNPVSGLSSASVGGSNALGSTQSGNGNWIVNLPAAAGMGSGGALAFALSSLNKAYNLDIILSALESTGEGKVISQPKISALDNKEAKVEQGLSIPYATTSASGTQIQFIDAKLALTVTPHATPDNKVFLKVVATKNAPDTSILGATGQPSIRKNEATTEILLADGETAVIAGILTLERAITDSKVPWLADIPGIGWMFKKRNTTDKRGELLIFLTPRIVKQEVI